MNTICWKYLCQGSKGVKPGGFTSRMPWGGSCPVWDTEACKIPGRIQEEEEAAVPRGGWVQGTGRAWLSWL